MRVVLGTFTRFCVETRFGEDLATGVQAAARHYFRRRKGARAPVSVTGLPGARRLEKPQLEVEVAIDREIEELLEDEARCGAVDVQQVLVHAVFVYLADLDRGARGLLVAVEEGPAPAR